MTCVYKEFQIKIKMVQEQLLQLKMKFLLGFNVDICYLVGGWLVESLLGGDEQILLVRGHLPPSPPVWKTLEVTSVTMKEPFHLHNFITKKLSLKLLM